MVAATSRSSDKSSSRSSSTCSSCCFCYSILLIQYYYHKRSCCVMVNITSSLTYCKLLNHCFQASKTFSSTVFKQGAYSFQIEQFRQGISLSMCLEFLRSACDILVTKLMKPTLKGNKTWVLFWFQTYLPPWHFILNLPKQ